MVLVLPMLNDIPILFKSTVSTLRKPVTSGIFASYTTNRPPLLVHRTMREYQKLNGVVWCRLTL